MDASDDVYFSALSGDVYKLIPPLDTVTTLISGLSRPNGLALDDARNIYVADSDNNTVEKWSAASNTLTVLVSNGLSYPAGLALDGSGNVYIADTGSSSIKKLMASSGSVTALVSSGLSGPRGVAVDGTGNVYIADTGNSSIKELPYVFVDPTPKSESAAASSDVLPPVLPVTANLLAPFAPTSDQPWLTITGIADGVVIFSLAGNTGPARVAHITLLGQTIPVSQAQPSVEATVARSVRAQMLDNRLFRFVVSNVPDAHFSVFTTTNLTLPMVDWTVIGTSSNIGPNIFEFTCPSPAADTQRFYRIRSP